MATPVSSPPIRYASTESEHAGAASGFAVWAWTTWIWGILPWVVFIVFAEPIVSAFYRGELKPAPVAVWVAVGLYDFLILVVLPAWAMYASWIYFSVVRVAGDCITVGRWFGVRSTVFRPSDIVTWRSGDWRWREVPEGRSAWKLRIDFSDGSWLRLSRTAWNFRKLEAWLQLWVPSRDSAARLASNATTSSCHFRVRDTRLTLIGLFAWVVTWIMSAMSVNSFLYWRAQTPSGTEAVVVYVVRLILIAVTFVVGPLCGYVAFKDVRVNGSRIDVVRWFGLSRRTYHEDDIKTWHARLDPKPPSRRKTDEPKITIRFADGAGVVVLGSAGNFDGLHQYLRARASSREYAGRGRTSDESRKQATA